MTDLNDGLVLYLPLNDGKNSTKLMDKSKYQNHGTISGAIAVRPYNDMSDDSEEEGEAPLVIIDDGGVAFWTLVAGAESDDTVTVKKGANSYKVALLADTLDMYHDYGSNQDWSKYDFLSLWIYGCNTSDTITLYVYNEVYASKTNGYSYAITDDFTGWRRFIIPKERFSDVVTPTGWNGVRCIEILGSGAQTCDYYFDRLTFDVGNWRFGDTMKLDGTNDYIRIPDDDSLDFSDGEFTASIWIQNMGKVDGRIFYKYGAPDNHGFSIYSYTDGTVKFVVFSGTTATPYSVTNIADDGLMHMVTLSMNASGRVRGYVDGKLEKTQTITPSSISTSTDLFIGSTNGGGSFTSGNFSNFRLYNRELTIEEIGLLYKEKKIDLNRGLVLDLPMDEGSGDIVYDKSKHQNHGTLNGQQWANEGPNGEMVLYFDGSDVTDVASVPNTNLSFSNGLRDFSMGLWIRYDNQVTTGEYVVVRNDYESGSPRRLWGFVISNNVIRFEVYDVSQGTPLKSSQSKDLSDDNWHLIVAVKSGDSVFYYVDGKIFSITTGWLDYIFDVSSLGNLALGRYQVTMVNPFVGYMKQLKVWNRALSSQEVRTLYLNES